MSNPKKIYGLIGYPVRHSLSPLMHNAAFHALKINAEYRLFEVRPQDLEDFLLTDKLIKDIQDDDVRAKDISGFNITIPHKVKAREILENAFPRDASSPKALDASYFVTFTGAVNTVKRETDRLEYFNTDAPGFLRSLTEELKFNTDGTTILVVGCGGAGRAVIAALGRATFTAIEAEREPIRKIFISDIDTAAINSAKEHFCRVSQFSYLKDTCEFILAKELPDIVKDCDLLINASPIGMRGEDVSVVDKKLLHEDLYIYDIVYNRDQETRLVRDARSRRLRVADGLSMLLYQGMDAFQIWTNQEAPVDVMRKALNEGVKRI